MKERNSSHTKQWDFVENKGHLKLLVKRLRRYYRNQTSHSITLRKWTDDQKAQYTSYNQDTINTLVNLVVTLENHFSIDRDLAIKLSKKIHKKHRNYIRAYMVDWFNIGRSGQRDKLMKPSQAIREFKARGFILLKEANLDKTKPYIRSNVGNLVYPKQPSLPNKNFGGVYELLPKVGIAGYTGITLPVKFLDKKSYRIHKVNY